MLHSPPSITASITPSKQASTSPAVLGLFSPEGFADGAASGTPHCFKSSIVFGCCGQRSPMVSPPARTISGIPFFAFKTIVSGPGQKTSDRKYAAFGTSTQSLSIISEPLTIRLRGLLSGLPFALKTRFTAASSRPLAARPYTVSVGTATSPPSFIISAAAEISSQIILVCIKAPLDAAYSSLLAFIFSAWSAVISASIISSISPFIICSIL